MKIGMLTYLGKYNEKQIAEAAKAYLPLYGKQENEVCKVPFKKQGGKVRYVQFTWLAQNWVFTDIVD